MKPGLMVAIDLASESIVQLEGAHTVYRAKTAEARAEIARIHGDSIRAVMTNGITAISAALMDCLPRLEIICAQGVGYEGVDLAAARERGIMVTHGPGTNADCVADHAMGLLLALLRDIVGNATIVQAGGWRGGRPMRPAATGKRMGLLGFGQIGSRIARRAAAFDMPVGYCTRQPRPDVDLPYFPDAKALAEWADILVVVVPGGAATRHMIDAAALAALGPQGYLVNVGRGSVVETTALVEALQAGGIAGAALDVMEGEPDVPQTLRDCPNIVLTPHMAGFSPESIQATITLVLANLEAHFAGRPVLTPIPEWV